VIEIVVSVTEVETVIGDGTGTETAGRNTVAECCVAMMMMMNMMSLYSDIFSGGADTTGMYTANDTQTLFAVCQRIMGFRLKELSDHI